ncbi:helix-turn-helix transcriptional regulator [Staphylospora marina]|uniref:helix-turn-helix transcriptional regulator n=1 Tax=Staphylospora marina TaxID=2490858 RepID=UPI000F5C227E|nr:WYL domain-containing protein [Staphylospora marina]
MSKVHQVHAKYRDRLIGIIAELLRDPGPHGIKDAAKRYGISQEKLRKDLNYLIKKLNHVNKKEYIIRGRGYFEGNFARAVANLSPEVRLYLFLALRQVQPMLKGEGEKAYRELLEHAYSVLSEEDVRRLKEWSDFYFVSEYGYPQSRSHFYQSLQEVFEAIRFNKMLRFKHKGNIRYFDPFGVFYAKHTFYLIGHLMKTPDVSYKKLIHIRLDRIQDMVRTIHSSPLGRKKEEVWPYKRNHVQNYIRQMLEAEHGRNKCDYVIRIYDQNVFQRIQEKQWHPDQVIRPIEAGEAVGEIIFPGMTSWMEIKKWVLGWGSAVELIKPAEKRKELWEEIKTMFLKRYGSGG